VTKRERVRVTRENAMAMRVVGTKEGEGGKAIVMAKRVVGKQIATAMMRVMVTKMKEVGEEEGNGKGSKSDCDGKEDRDGKQ
jgi:hypothetical protein